MEVMINSALPKLSESYLFEEAARQAADFEVRHPLSRIISLGIGDVTQPLTPVVTGALRTAAAEMGNAQHHRGYGPAAGYPFLRQAIAEQYRRGGYSVSAEEVTVTGGAKESLGAVLSLFDPAVPVWVCDPVYPAYRDCAISAGFRVFALPCRAEEDFIPRPAGVTEPGIIFLCSPNNPTGAVLSTKDWEDWISFARQSGSILITDAAYSAYITEEGYPRSVYEIAGAQECAIEVNSFSKSAGFTGLRCGWVILPKKLSAGSIILQPFWRRWLACHANGISYPVQRAAEAALSTTGQQQGESALAVYRRNAERLMRHFAAAGIPFWGGRNAPYLWVRCPEGCDSWGMFRRLLAECGVLCTPGAGFGEQGEGYLRFTAFATEDATAEAIRRIASIL